MSVQVFDARGIVRAPGFDDAAAVIFGSVARADEALEGIELAVAREPISWSVAVPGTSLRAVITATTASWPGVVVLFRHNQESVHLVTGCVLAGRDLHTPGEGEATSLHY